MVVYGNESERFAAMLNTEIRRPMTRGVLNPGEPDSVKLIREIVVMPDRQGRAEGPEGLFQRSGRAARVRRRAPLITRPLCGRC